MSSLLKKFLIGRGQSSALFDHDFYRKRYLPDATNYEDCLEHYLSEGAKQFYTPHWLIDPYFLVSSGRVKRPETLLQELTVNLHKIDTCHPIFDPEYYRARNRKSMGRRSPFVHYLKQGACRNLRPSAWFDPDYYFARNGDLDPSTTIAARHFLSHAVTDYEVWRGVRSPSWWFNIGYYFQRWDIRPYSDPLAHLVCENPERLGINYLFDRLSEARPLRGMSGAELENLAENLARKLPSKLEKVFDPNYYKRIHSDLRKSDINPVKHFVAHGSLEQRVHLAHPPLEGVCIVTPDALGPIKNGGIGTACFHYAVSSARAGNPTFVLYTGPMNLTGLLDIEKMYARNGVRFDYISRLERMPRQIWATSRDLDTSFAVSRFLGRQRFDRIFFQDWRAPGFWSIRKKRLGRSFHNAHLTVICHSPSQWQDEGMHTFPATSLESAKVRWAERECIRNADSVICPSRHMENWLRKNDYLGDGPVHHVPYTYNYGSSARPAPGPPLVLAFFGRLEKRKGLDVFLEALSILSPEKKAQIKKILFLGKIAMVDGIKADTLIETAMEETGLEFERHSTLDTNEAISLLQRENAVAVVPSIVDNLPLVVIECLAHNIPLLASSVGGIPELVPESALFEPAPGSLAAALVRMIRDGVQACAPLWTADSAQSNWSQLLTKLRPEPRQPQPRDESTNPPPVSVCVPNCNHARYLPSLMRSLARQTQLPERVVLVDDGSTEPETEAALADLERKNWPFEFQIIRSKNSGPGRARNLAADATDTPLLCFVDADNLPEQTMIESMRHALLHGRVDAVFGTYKIHDTDAVELDPDGSEEIYMPLGNYTGSAWIQNDMGDSFVIIRKETFHSLGGFDDARSAHEDWLFAFRLNISGARVTSLCDPLLHYRRTGTSRSRKMNEFRHCKSLQELAQSAPEAITSKWIEQMIWQGYQIRRREH